MKETLGPISHTISTHGLVSAHVAIVAGTWPPVHENSCHGMHSLPLFRALDVSMLCHFGSASPAIAMDAPWNTTQPTCFKRATQVAPDAAGDLHQRLLRWEAMPNCNSTRLRTVIIQRNSTRRIGNVERLRAIALEFTRNVHVIQLEGRPIHDQIQAMTCGNPVVAAVHGAGLAWAMLLKSTGRFSAVTEWTWPKWQHGKEFYVRRVRSNTVMAFESKLPLSQTWCPRGYVRGCCAGDCDFPTKHVDVNVSEGAWRSDLSKAISHMKTQP